VQTQQVQEKLEDIKEVTRSHKSNKNIQYNGQRTTGQTTLYKTLLRKLKT